MHTALVLYTQDQHAKLVEAAGQGCTYNARLQISNPRLRTWMGLRTGEEVWHSVQITASRDPSTLEDVFIVSQVGSVCQGHSKLMSQEHLFC